MPSFYARSARVGYRNTLVILEPTKSQRVVGTTMVSPYRTNEEKQPYETLTVSGLLIGSEVRLVTDQNTEFVAGEETAASTTLSWTYKAPLPAKILTLNVIKPGYHVFSQEVTVGSGNINILVIQRFNEAYI